MRINTMHDLEIICRSIYLFSSKLRINKFYIDHTYTIDITIDEFTYVIQNHYIYQVLVSAFKEHNGLDITLGASCDRFTIALHMNIYY